MATKKKNVNYYKANKFKNVNWQAKVTNDETKERATLDFSKNFYQRAYDLKSVKTKINKELNNVTAQIKKIKKDKDTGKILVDALTGQLNAYETARKEFLNSVKALYNGAINEFNDWLQFVYTQLSQSAITNQGSAQTVQSDSISEGDDSGTEG